jgi:hypothetical protein
MPGCFNSRTDERCGIGRDARCERSPAGGPPSPADSRPASSRRRPQSSASKRSSGAGNTFTVIAFQHAQPELVSIAPTFTPSSARRWTGGTRTRTAAAGRSSSGGGGRLRRRSRGRQSSSSGTGRPRCPVSARARSACTPRSRRTRVDRYSGVKSTPLYRITLAYGENSPVRTTALASAVISFSSWWDTDDSAAVRSRTRRASTIWGLDSLAIV